MRDACRKIPEVSLADVLLKGASVLVNGGDPRPALEHVGPLGRLVPVQLPDAACREPHVDTGDLGGDGQLAYCRLPPPAAGRNMVMAVRERPSQVWQRAVVGLRRGERVRVLGLTFGVRRSNDGCTQIAPNGFNSTR